ncbi:hypothetical protein KDE12_06345 [Campylobacter sp. faydin G-105]|uniref:hypothetical protein n=1 Tax=Campylobacter anatolicus TaxID=2829105 RepID=UPI001BA0DF25|nr:hypothetical protein [Campylobacter anatolicus]MBR8462474.1 hypothetical protein [Campylobacter anatolicus]
MMWLCLNAYKAREVATLSTHLFARLALFYGPLFYATLTWVLNLWRDNENSYRRQWW